MKRILSAILLLCLVGIVAPVSAKADKNEVSFNCNNVPPLLPSGGGGAATEG